MTLRIAFLAATISALTPASAQNFGTFIGSFAGVFLEQGWRFKLSADLVYIDPAGKRWLAPKDSVVDGASIPRIFWTPIGGPFEGEYRNASAVHDVVCVKKERAVAGRPPYVLLRDARRWRLGGEGRHYVRGCRAIEFSEPVRSERLAAVGGLSLTRALSQG